MDESEDALEIDDTEILQILEETLYKVPTATASDLPTSNVTAASSSRPRSQTEEAAPTLSTSLKTTNGVETKRKVRLEGRGGVDRQGEAALPSQVNRPDCSSKGISWFFGSQGRQRCVEPQGVDNKVVEEGVKSALPKELQPDESYVGSPPLPVLPYVIPGPGGFVQKALETGKPGRSRQVLPELKEDLRPFEQGKVGTEESRFTDEPWRSAIDVLNRRAGERATIRDIKAYGFRGPVSKFVAMIVALNLDGYGGAFVTVEDPTGKLNGTIHKSVFAEEKYAKHIEFGAILVLQNVPIFRPNATARLISITAINVVQIFKAGLDSKYEETEPCRTPSQAGLKPEVATTGHFSRSQASKPPIPIRAPMEVDVGSNKRSVEAAGDKFCKGREVDDAQSTGPCRESPADAEPSTHFSRGAGRDLEKDLDKLLECSLEDLYD